MSVDKSGLQKCINNLEIYSKTRGLVVSLKRTRRVIFSKSSTKYTNHHQFISGKLVKLRMNLLDSKIEIILTYGSIIWGIENSNNSIIISCLKSTYKQPKQ